MTNLSASWQRAWAHLDLNPPDGLYEALLAAYGEPQRHYHTIQHLAECIHHFESVISHAVEPGAVELALWFHDAIYDVRGKDNEQRSAEWAVKVLLESGASQALCKRVSELVMVTRHDAAPTDPDQKMLVDIDLVILGAAPKRFDEYDHQVRAEYAWVPGMVYRFKRKSVLKEFLARPSIYYTEYFRSKFELQARLNLQCSLKYR